MRHAEPTGDTVVEDPFGTDRPQQIGAFGPGEQGEFVRDAGFPPLGVFSGEVQFRRSKLQCGRAKLRIGFDVRGNVVCEYGLGAAEVRGFDLVDLRQQERRKILNVDPGVLKWCLPFLNAVVDFVLIQHIGCQQFRGQDTRGG